jgi:glycosyltransferase involved in cell wall biosynthesis
MNELHPAQITKPHTVVSVVVPAYNHAETLPAAIDSLLAQDYPALEIIVLDDGSTDHTREVLTAYGSRIRWETHPNMGQAATLNKGWAMAGGEILGYLSADDFLYPDAVSTAVAALAVPSAIVTYCDFDLVDPDGRRLRQVLRPEFSLETVLTTLDCPPGPGAFFRRSAFDAAGGWNPALRQIPDFDFWLRLARLGRFIHVPKTLAAWRVHPGSQSFAVVGPERAEESVRVITAFFAAGDLDPRLRPLELKSKARAHLYCAQLHARAGRYRAAASNIAQAHQLFPGTALQWHTWRSVANALLSRPSYHLVWWLRKITGAKA